MATKTNIRDRVIKPQGAEVFIQEEEQEEEKKYTPESDITSDKTNYINGDKKSDAPSDKISDNSSAVTGDNYSDNTSDNNSDNTSDNNSDMFSDINSDMFNPKKQAKYVDMHERRTHYITKDNIRLIDDLYAKFNQDKSDTVNKALNLYREYLKKKAKK